MTLKDLIIYKILESETDITPKNISVKLIKNINETREVISRMVLMYTQEKYEKVFIEFLRIPTDLVAKIFIKKVEWNLYNFYIKICEEYYQEEIIYFINQSNLEQLLPILNNYKIHGISNNLLKKIFNEYGVIGNYIEKYIEFEQNIIKLNRHNITAIDYIFQTKRYDLLDKLLQRDSYTIFQILTKAPRVYLEYIFKRGINIDNLLAIASQYDNLKVIKLLLKKGANPNVIGQFKITPLMYASLNHNVKIIKLFLNKSSNLNDLFVSDITIFTKLIDQIIDLMTKDNIEYHNMMKIFYYLFNNNLSDSELMNKLLRRREEIFGI